MWKNNARQSSAQDYKRGVYEVQGTSLGQSDVDGATIGIRRIWEYYDAEDEAESKIEEENVDVGGLVDQMSRVLHLVEMLFDDPVKTSELYSSLGSSYLPLVYSLPYVNERFGV